MSQYWSYKGNKAYVIHENTDGKQLFDEIIHHFNTSIKTDKNHYHVISISTHILKETDDSQYQLFKKHVDDFHCNHPNIVIFLKR